MPPLRLQMYDDDSLSVDLDVEMRALFVVALEISSKYIRSTVVIITQRLLFTQV